MFCCICSATASRDSSNPSNKIQLFRCPKSVEKYSTNSSPFVCSQHFTSMYMKEDKEGEVWLRADAIPTLCLPMTTSYNDNRQPKSPNLINTLSSRNNLENSSQLVNNITSSSLKSASDPLPRISEDPNDVGTFKTPISGEAKGVATTRGRCSPKKPLAHKTDNGRSKQPEVPKSLHEWETSLRPEFDNICGEPIWSFATYQDLEMFASLSIDQQNQILASILSEEPEINPAEKNPPEKNPPGMNPPEMNQESTEPSLTDTVKPADLPGSTNIEMEEAVIEERARLRRLDRYRPTPKRVRLSRKKLMAQLRIKDDQIAHLQRQVRRLKQPIASSGSSFQEENSDIQMDNGSRPSVLRLSHYIPVIPTASVKISSKEPPEEIIIDD